MFYNRLLIQPFRLLICKLKFFGVVTSLFGNLNKTKIMKKLKKISTLLTLFLLIFQANAQVEKGFYMSANLGYNKGTGNVNATVGNVFELLNSTRTGYYDSTVEYVKTNLGQGLNTQLNVGYMLNKNMGLELGMNYLFGGKTNTTLTSYTTEYTNSEISAKMIQIKPTIVFKAGFDKINPYAKVGMIMGSGKITISDNSKQIVSSGEGGTKDLIINRTLTLKEGIPIGFHGSLGTLYKINDKISLFGEINLTSLTYTPEKGSYTQYDENGVSKLPAMSVHDKEKVFGNSFAYTNVSSPANEPEKIVKMPFSFSSVGLNIGLQYQF